MRMNDKQLWSQLDMLAAGWTKDLTITVEDARRIMREVRALQRIIREMGTGEALLVRNVYEHFNELPRCPRP
jgi:hypothetical protein